MQSAKTPRSVLDRLEPKSKARASPVLGSADRFWVRIVAVIVMVALFVLSALAMLEVEPIPTKSPLDARTDLNIPSLSSLPYHPDGAGSPARGQSLLV